MGPEEGKIYKVFKELQCSNGKDWQIRRLVIDEVGCVRSQSASSTPEEFGILSMGDGQSLKGFIQNVMTF